MKRRVWCRSHRQWHSERVARECAARREAWTQAAVARVQAAREELKAIQQAGGEPPAYEWGVLKESE